MCTYDKLPKLLEHINANDCRLLVDEYHNLLKQYSFRDRAIDGVLDNFKAFKSFCFMSATPIEADLKPNVLDGVVEYVADWKEPLSICVLPHQTNKPYQFAANIIDKYKLQGYLEVNGHKSREAYFFLNSVQEIAHIIQQCGLTNDNCRVICANTKNSRACITAKHTIIYKLICAVITALSLKQEDAALMSVYSTINALWIA